MDVLLIGNDQTLEVSGVRDEISGAYIGTATVTAAVKNINGTAVAGGTWPITLTHVASSPEEGVYRGTIEDGVTFLAGIFYVIEITVDAGSDLIAFWRKEVVAQYRSWE